MLRGRSTVPAEDGVTWSTARNCCLENGKHLQLSKSSGPRQASDDKKKKGGKEIVRKETEALDEAHHKIVDEYEKWERDNVYYGKRYTQEELEMFEKSRIEAIEFEAEMEAKRKERVR